MERDEEKIAIKEKAYNKYEQSKKEVISEKYALEKSVINVNKDLDYLKTFNGLSIKYKSYNKITKNIINETNSFIIDKIQNFKDFPRWNVNKNLILQEWVEKLLEKNKN